MRVPEDGNLCAALSARQTEVLSLLAQDYTQKEIAAHLGLSADTVHAHVRGVYDILGVHTAAGAVGAWMRGGAPRHPSTNSTQESPHDQE